MDISQELKEELGAEGVSYDANIAKISAIGISNGATKALNIGRSSASQHHAPAKRAVPKEIQFF